MKRRTFIQAVAAGAGLSLLDKAAMAASGKDHTLAGVGEAWVGAPALAGGKAYAACPLGALHYRMLPGDGDRAEHAVPILLIHQTPFGMAEWVDIQPMLAAKGHTVIAPDNPGYGMSDAPPKGVTVAQLADNLISLLDHLNIEKVLVAGHHTGAAIAAAFAARHPGRTAAAVLHGCPLYTAAEREERLGRVGPEFEPQADGSHLADVFRAIHGIGGRQPEALAPATWATLGSYLAGSNPPTYKAVFANDMAADIARITAPTLILTDTADGLHAKDLQAAKLRSDFVLETFSQGGSFSLMLDPQAWADQVATFASRLD